MGCDVAALNTVQFSQSTLFEVEDVKYV
jgi:hypothetical protein